jgi:flagellin
LDGTYSDKKFHIGANANQNMVVGVTSMKTDAIGSTDFTGGTAVTSAGSITTDFSTTNATVTISDNATTPNTVAITLDQDYGTADEVVKAINEAIAEDADLGGKVEAKLLDGNKITFIAKDAEATYSVDGEDAFGFASGSQDIDNSPAFVSSLRVDNVETATAGGVLTQGEANEAITIVDDAIKTVSAERSKLGAYQNRLEHTINNLGTSAENLQAAESRIRDLDMAEEIMAFTKNNILQQAATAMLAQANMAPQSVLQLLG